MKNQNFLTSGYYEADGQLWRAEPGKSHVERFCDGKWGEGDFQTFWYNHNRISHEAAQELACELGRSGELPKIEELPA